MTSERTGSGGRLGLLGPWAVATGVFGMSFGSVGAALDVPKTLLVGSSVLVFSPSAQFAALGLAAGDGAVVAGFLTALLLVSRMFVVGIPMSPEFDVRGLRRLLATHLVIDASVITALPEDSTRRRQVTFLEVGVTVYLAWIVGTAAGAWAGSGLGDLDRLGLDAALPSMFLVLVVPLLVDRRAVAAFLIGGMTAVATIPLLPRGAPVLLACAAGFAALAVPKGRRS